MDKRSIIYLVGTSGAGKTWICNQLDPSKFHVIEYDKIRRQGFVEAIKTAPQELQVVAVTSIKVSTFRKLLDPEFDIRMILVYPSLEETKKNILARGGKVTIYLDRRYQRFGRLQAKSEFIGDSTAVLNYLTGLDNTSNQNKITIVGVLPKFSGIYKITNTKNSKSYIGQALNLYNRYYEHLSTLRFQRHHNLHLQAAVSLIGIENFTFEVLEILPLDKSLLTQREQYWMDYYKSLDNKFGYNFVSAVDGHLGMKRSEETKNKISLSRTGKSLSEDHKQQIGVSVRKFHLDNPDFGTFQTKTMVKIAADLHRDKPLSEGHKDLIKSGMKKVIKEKGPEELIRLQEISRIGTQHAANRIHEMAKARLHLTRKEEIAYEAIYKQDKPKKEIFNDRKQFIRMLEKKRKLLSEGV